MGTTVTVLVPPQHPAFDGHFPDAPLLPGVVLLDEMLRVVEEARVGGGARVAAGSASVAATGVGVTRVVAFVVAPGLDAAALNEELRRRIDPVFLPRPLLLVERLPRNDTGKLPREALLALAAQHLRPAS